jgi:hypothetical protein
MGRFEEAFNRSGFSRFLNSPAGRTRFLAVGSELYRMCYGAPVPGAL